MSILAFIGLPGSGKSFGIVQNVIIPNLKKRRTIVTNLPLNAHAIRSDLFDPFEALPIHLLSDDDFKTCDLLSEYPGAIFVIDEAQKYFPQGMTESKLPGHFKDFFSIHRHSVCPTSGFTAEVILATQDLSKIAKPVRVLIDYTYIAKKLSSVGMDNRYRVDIYEGAQTIDYQKGEPVNQISGKYEEPYTSYYNSHTMKTDDSVVANEQRADQRSNIFKSKKVRLYLLAMLAAPFVVIWSIVNVKDNLVPQQQVELAEANQSVSSSRSTSPNTIDQPIATSSARRSVQSSSSLLYQLPEIANLDDQFGYFDLDRDAARVVYRHITQTPIHSQVVGLPPSQEWRYSGHFQHRDGSLTHYAINSQGTVRRLPESDCYYYDHIDDYVCSIGSTQVAVWTGVGTDIGHQATNNAPVSSIFNRD